MRSTATFKMWMEFDGQTREIVHPYLISEYRYVCLLMASRACMHGSL